MNHIYRLVWNKKRHMLMAVAEIASTNGKETGADSSVSTAVAGADGAFSGARTLLAAAVMTMFPMTVMAQSTHLIPANTVHIVSDSDGSNAAIGAWTIHNDGTLDISATDAGTNVQGLSGSGAVLLGERTLTLTDASQFYTGTIRGSGGLTLSGGMEILGGTNTYLGATTIGPETTLALSGSGSIALSSGVINDGKFDISATDQGAAIRSLAGSDSGSVLLGSQTLVLSAASGQYGGTIDGQGGLKVAAGSEVLSGVNTYSGVTAIGSGASLALAGSGSIAFSSGVVADGQFDIAHANGNAQVSSLSGSGSVALGQNSLALTGNGSNFGGAISGNGGLTVDHGRHVLGGANTYIGATGIASDSTLALQGSGSIAMSSGLANNGVFDIAATNKGAEVGALSGSGMVLLGGQTLTLTNASGAFDGSIHGSGGLALASGYASLSAEQEYTGKTTVGQWADLALTGAGSIAASSEAAVEGTLNLAGLDQGAKLQSLSGSGAVLLGDDTLTLTDAHSRFDGVIYGEAGLTVAGGTQVLGGSNEYGGVTRIEDGAGLALAGSGSIALSSGVIADGTFDIVQATNGAQVSKLSGSGMVLLGDNALALTGKGSDFAGAISGQGDLSVTRGTHALSGTNTYAGATDIGANGTLSLRDSGSIAMSNGLANNGVFDIAATKNGAEVSSMSGSGMVLLGGQNLTLTNASGAFDGSIRGSGGLELAGGQITLTAEQHHTGKTTVGQWTELALTGAGSIAASSEAAVDGRLNLVGLDQDAQLQSLSGSGAVLLGDNYLALTGNGSNFGGAISGYGGLSVEQGSHVLSGTNTYTGATGIGANGTLALRDSGSIAMSDGLANNGIFDIAATSNGAEVSSMSGSGMVLLGGQNLTLTNASGAFDGSIRGSGGLELAGGQATLTGEQHYTGKTTIGQGAELALTGAGSIAASSEAAIDGKLNLAGLEQGAELQSLSGSGAVLLGDNALALTGNGSNFGGAISGNGGLTVNQGSHVLGGENTYLGATDIASGGTLALRDSGSIAMSNGLANNGVFDIAATNNGAEVSSMSGSGMVLLGGQNLTLTNASGAFDGSIHGSGGLELAGGQATLTGEQQYTGKTTIGQGAELALTGQASIAYSHEAAIDGKLDLAGLDQGAALQSLSGSGTVLLGNDALTLTDAHGRFDGVIQGEAGLTVAGGAQVLGGVNTYNGVTRINQGAGLSLAGSGSIALSSGVVADGTFDIAHATSGAQVGSLSGSGAVLMGDNALVLNGQGGDFAGDISGNGGLSVTQGTHVLSGANSYGGATGIDAGGTLALRDSGSIAMSNGLANNGVFDIAATNNGAEVSSMSGSGMVLLGSQTLTLTAASGSFDGSIHGSGGLELAGGHTTLTAEQQYTGKTTIGQGAELALTGAGSLATSNQAAIDGKLDLAGLDQDAKLQSLSGSGAVLLGDNALTLTDAHSRFDGVIEGDAGLTVAGGAQVLGGINQYNGVTQIEEGAGLSLAGSGSIALSSGVVADGTFDIAQATNGAQVSGLSGSGAVLLGDKALALTGNGGDFGGVISGHGGLSVTQGTHVLSGANTYAGATGIDAGGTLALRDSGSIAMSNGLANNGVFDIVATRNGAEVSTMSGSGMVLLGGQNLTLTQASGVFDGSIHGSGGLELASGHATLSAGQHYSGTTTVGQSAELSLTGQASIAHSNEAVIDGKLDLAALDQGAQLQSLSGSGTVLLGDDALTLTDAHSRFDGAIQGAGGLTVAGGTQVLGGVNDYGGATRIDDGAQLTLAGSGSIALSSGVIADGKLDIAQATNGAQVSSLSGSGAVLLGDKALALTGNGSNFNGAISGNGALAINQGTHVLGGTNTYSGATDIASGGTLALRDSGSIAISNGLANNGVFDIAATNNGAEVSSMSGSGMVLLGGQTLTLTQASGAFDGSIHGSGGLELAGGQTTLTAEQQYTGKTTIGQGAELALTGAGSLATSNEAAIDGKLDLAGLGQDAKLQSLSGSGAVLLGDNALTLTDAHSRFDGVIQGEAGLTVAGGAQVLGGINQYNGVTRIEYGAGLALAGSGSIALSSGVVADGTFDIAQATNGAQVSSLSGSGAVLLGDKALALTDNGSNFNGAISGNGALAINQGTHVLGGANTYSGATDIASGGTLALRDSGSIAMSDGLANNGVFDIATTSNGAEVSTMSGSGMVLLGGQTLTLTQATGAFDGSIHGSGGLELAGGKTTLTSEQQYTGKTTISQGTELALTGAGSLATSNEAAIDGKLDLAGLDQGAKLQSLSGSGTVLLGDDALTLTDAHGRFDGAIQGVGGLTVAGGTQVLGGMNTYNGVTQIDEGAGLSLAGSGSIALSSGVIADGKLDIAHATNGAQVSSLSGSGAVLLGDNALALTGNGSNFSGAISGNGALAINHGTHVLGGTNTYSGATDIASGGTLALRDSGSIAMSNGLANNGVFDIAATNNGAEVSSMSGSGMVLLGGQTLTLTQASGAFDGSIHGSGGLELAGGHATLTGEQQYTGKTTVGQSAELSLTGQASIANSNEAAIDGKLDLAGLDQGAALQSLSGSGTVLLGDDALILTDAHSRFDGAIKGAGGLTVAGGIQVLGGINQYNGVTQIDEGAGLSLAGSGSISLSSGVIADGTLDIAQATNGAQVGSLSGSGAVLLGEKALALTGNGSNFDGAISGNGGLAVNHGTHSLGGANPYAGATDIASGGTLALRDSGSIAMSDGLANNGVFDIAATNNGAEVSSMSGSGMVLLGGQTLTLTQANGAFDGSIHGSGGLELAGGHTTLTGEQHYTGKTTVGQSAELSLTGQASIADSNEAAIDGKLDLAGLDQGAQLQSLSGSGTVLLGDDALTLTDAHSRFDGAIQGAGGLTVAGGTQVLGGINQFSGVTQIDEGAGLALAGSGSIALSSGVIADGTLDIAQATNGAQVSSLSGSGAVLLGDKALALTGNGSDFVGAISGNGALAINQGTHVLGGANTYSGATDIASGGTLALRDSGSIAVSNGLANNGVFDIAATNNGAEVSTMSGSGMVLLGGQTLTLTQAGGAFDGSIHGSGGLELAGGHATLTSEQQYTGKTTVDQGAELALTGAGSLATSNEAAIDGKLDLSGLDQDAKLQSLSGSGTVLLGDDALTLTDAHSRFDGAIQGAGGLTVAGGTQVLGGVNGYSGATRIDDGAQLTLSGSGSIALSSGVIADGKFDIAQATNGAQVSSLSGSGAVLLGDNALALTGNGSNFGGAISGKGALAIDQGTHVLGGTNTYSGATDIASGGTLALRDSGSIAMSDGLANNGVFDIAATKNGAEVTSMSGSGTVLLGDDALTLTDAHSRFDGVIAGAGGLTVAGGHQLLTGSNTYSGATRIDDGAQLTLTGSGSIALSSNIVADGTLDVAQSTNGAQLGSLSGSGTVLLGDHTLALSGNGSDFHGAIGGNGSLTVDHGVHVLGGASSYTGATAIGADGTLALQGSGSIAMSSGLANNGVFDIAATRNGAAITTMSGAGQVQLGGKTLTLTNANGAFDGSIHGSGGLELAGGHATLTGEQHYTGKTTVSQGAALSLSGVGSISASSEAAIDGKLDLAALDKGAALQSLSGSGTVLLGDDALTLTDAHTRFAGAIQGAGGLTVGGGNQFLTGTNTYSGATRIDDGAQLTLSGSGSIALSSGVVADGTFDIARTTNGAQVASLSGDGAVRLGGQVLTLTDASGNFSGSIQGSGGLVIASGTEVLSGVNTYSGDTVVARAGSLALSGDGSIANSRVTSNGSFDISDTNTGAAIKSLAGAGAVELGGKTLTLTDAGDTFAGSINGSGGLAIAGGTAILSGDNRYTGATSIATGATLGLSGSGSLALSSGVIANGMFDVSGANSALIKSLSGAGAVKLGSNTLRLTDASGTFSGAISGNGGLFVQSGREILSGVNTYRGVTGIGRRATLALAGNGSIADSRVEVDGTFDIAASNGKAAVKSLGGAGTVRLGNQTLTLTQGSGSFGGAITGLGGLTVAGGSTLLTGDNTYTGLTRIAAGAALGLSGTGSLAASSGIVADGSFDISAADSALIKSLSGAGAVKLGDNTLQLTNAGGTFSGVISGNGGLFVQSGRETLSGVNTYRGVTGISRDATLALAGKGSIADSRVEVDGTFDIAAVDGKAAVKSLTGAGTVRLGDRTLTLTEASGSFGGAITGAGGLTLAGGSTLLTGDNTYTGLTSIAADATLGLSGQGSLAASSGVLANGAFDVSGADSAQIKTLSGAGVVSLGNNTLQLSNATGSFSGIIKGNGGLDVAAGSTTLAGVNTYGGATTIGRAATLALAGNGGIANSRVNVGGTFDISGGNDTVAVQGVAGAGTISLGNRTLSLTGSSGSFDGTITGAGGIKLAGGELTLSQAQDYTGATAIATDARLALSGKGRIGGVLDLGGVFDIAAADGKVTLASLNGAGSVLLGANDLGLTRGGVFSGTLAGAGGVSLTGGTLALGGDNTYLGKTVVSNATLRTAADANLGRGRDALELRDGTWNTIADLEHDRGLLLAGRGTVDVDSATTTTETGGVSGSGMLVKEGEGTLILGGSVAHGGGLRVDGGTLALTAVNTFTGDTTIGAKATLRIDRDANLGAAGNDLIIDGGRLQTTGTLDSARAIEITARNGVVDTEGADSIVTLDGNISGAGRIVKDGEGTLVLAGDNAGGQLGANRPGDGWTGGLTINSGLVKVTNSWGLGWGSVMTFNAGTIHATVDILTGQDIKMGRSTDINVDAGTTTTLAGDLISSGAGDGCFNKTGLGTLNVLGAARIDATCVLEGKLLANGVFASKVTVAKGATLGGAGTLQGDVVVHGTLSPGNSPGMLTADSNITMASGSTYKQDIGGAQQASASTPIGAAGHYSYLQVVNGKRFAIEAGATLAPALANLYTPGQPGYGSAQFVPELGQNFRILSADGGIDGRFDTLVQPAGMGANTRLAAFYDHGGNNSIELKVLPASYATWSQDAGANARSVGAALDRIVDLDQAGQGSTAQTSLSYATASRNAQQLGGVLQGLAGEVHGALAAALPQAGWELQRTLLQRGAAQDGRALWIDLAAGRASWNGGDVASDFDADRMQVSVGVDVFKERDLRLGFGVSHASTDLDAQAGNGKLRQNKVFAYGQAAAGNVVFDLQGSYGRDKTESQRADPLAAGAGLSTRGEGNSALLGAGVSLPTAFAGSSLAPFGRVAVQRVERDALHEGSGSVAALALDGWSATGTRVVTGVAGSSRNVDPLLASTWRFNLGAGVDAGELLRPQLGATLAGTRIAIGAPDVGRGFVQGSVNATVQLKQGTYLYFGVSGEARSDYRTVGGNAGVRGVF